jgi:hypothetical protein
VLAADLVVDRGSHIWIHFLEPTVHSIIFHWY